MLAAPRRVLAHRRIINLYAVLSGRPLRANLSLWPLLTALTLRASITLGANRASFANRPLRAGITLLALYTLNALLTLGAALSGVALLAPWASRASCTRCPGRALNSLFSLRPLRAYGASRASITLVAFVAFGSILAVKFAVSRIISQVIGHALCFRAVLFCVKRSLQNLRGK